MCLGKSWHTWTISGSSKFCDLMGHSGSWVLLSRLPWGIWVCQKEELLSPGILHDVLYDSRSTRSGRPSIARPSVGGQCALSGMNPMADVPTVRMVGAVGWVFCINYKSKYDCVACLLMILHGLLVTFAKCPRSLAGQRAPRPEWPSTLLCLGPRGFLGDGTFSAKTRKSGQTGLSWLP